MRGFVDGHPVELMPAFRAEGRGRTLASVSLSIPLRSEDLVSILYHCKLGTEQLTDADAVREVIGAELVDKGADRIARDKARFKAALATRAASVDQERLSAIRQRVPSLFQRARRSRKAA